MDRTKTGTLLNAYCDSMGGQLKDIVEVLKKDEFKDTFESFYILPSVFNSDLDRGFSLVNYDLNESLASKEDIEELKKLNIRLMMDFVLNHISVLSPQFQDILKNGDESEYRDFFIDWNRFWEGCGEMTEAGYIQPDEKYIRDMFFRKAGLPILMVRFPDGRDVPYWNTFYQEINYPDLNAYELVRDLNLQYCVASEIADIFNHRNISEENHSDSSVHGMEQTIEHAAQDFTGLCFVNLVDFDAKWGHRRNPIGYGEEIERFDVKLGELLPLLNDDDLLIITADHGNDPTYKGTDHTREDVPLVIYSPSLKGSGLLPTQQSFGVIGATVAENFGVKMPEHCIGESILSLLK